MAYKANFGNGALGDVQNPDTTINSYARVTAVTPTTITINNTTKITGTDDSVSVQGTNPAVNDPEVAKTQIDKILALTGTKAVDVEGMTQTIAKEAVNNG